MMSRNLSSTIIPKRVDRRLCRLVGWSAVVMVLVCLLIGPAWAQAPEATQLGATLSSSQEVPPVTIPTEATGTAMLTINPDQTEIAYTIELTGPFTSPPVQAHIHVGELGLAGPVIFFLCADPSRNPPAGTPACPDVAGGTLSGTLTAANLVAQVEAGVPLFADAIAALLTGRTYINLHTTSNGPGELRGQIGSADLGAILSSAQEVPPVQTPSDAIGDAALILNDAQTELTYTVNLIGPFSGAPTQVHIHAGSLGSPGPVIFFLCADPSRNPPAGTPPCPDAAGGTLSGTLTDAHLVLQEASGIATFANAVNALLSGNAYLNAHTPANGPGELRGQIGAVKLASTLNGAQEVPPVMSQATGSAMVTLSGGQDAISYQLDLVGPFSGAPTQAHIHVGAVDGTGPAIFLICADPSTNPPVGTPACPDAAGGGLSGLLTDATLIPQMASGIVSFADAVDALLSGNAYFNVHTPANAPGEIRGQIGPKVIPTVSFSLRIQPIFTLNCATSGCHAGPEPRRGLNLEAGQAHGNLVGVPSGGIPTMNLVEPGDPEMSYLFKKHRGDANIVGSRMPRDNPTFFDDNPDLLELERKWIEEGALNN